MKMLVILEKQIQLKLSYNGGFYSPHIDGRINDTNCDVAQIFLD